MHSRDFLFSMNVLDERRCDEMLTVVARSLLRQADCGPDAARRILTGLRQALVEGAAAGLHQCHVEFRSEGKQMEVVVSYVGGRETRVDGSEST